VLRLFQMSPAIKTYLGQSESYREMLDVFQGALTSAVREDGFVGVKAHLAEEVGFGVEFDPVTEACFSAAKVGDSDAFKGLYRARAVTAPLLLFVMKTLYWIKLPSPTRPIKRALR
jgi:hypothetical protein